MSVEDYLSDLAVQLQIRGASDSRIRDIVAAYEGAVGKDEPLALAVVVHVEGSSYRRIGARMLIREGGSWFGGISGGCLEGDVLRKAKLALFENEAQRVRYDTSGEQGEGIGVGLGCNGVIDILICPVKRLDPANPVDLLKERLHTRKEGFLMTVVEPGASGLSRGAMHRLPEPGSLESHLPLTAPLAAIELEYTRAIRDKRSRLCEIEGGLQVLLEYFPPSIHLLILGGHYDVLPLVGFARQLGWITTVVADPDRVQSNIPQAADAFVSDDCGSVHIDQYTAILLMAHDLKTDRANLKQHLSSPAPYIGILGPRTRTESILAEIGLGEGIQVKAWPPQLYGPTGLDLGANNPEEVALSILAEILAVFSERPAGHLRNRSLPIHERD